MVSKIDTPTVGFDSTDQNLLFHDLELFEDVRAAGGIAWSPLQGGLWVVSDFEMCKRIAADDVRFLSGEGVRFPRSGNPMLFALEYDRPRHTAHREILTDLVGPRATVGLEPMVRAHANRLAAKLEGDGQGDLGVDYAYPLPLDVIFSLIGAPDELKPEMEQLAESLFLYRRPMPDGSDPGLRLDEILDELIAERLAAPTDSWLSNFVGQMNGGQHGLSETEIRGAVTGLLTAGHHSTARGLACLLAHIVTDPALQEALRADPSRIPAIAEESLRLNTPLRWFARTAGEDVTIGTQTIRRGDRVYMLYGAANRDPARFDHPNDFHPEGLKSSEHLAFGWGIHRCVGMPLAQLELRVAVEEIFAASDWITLTSEIEWISLIDPRHIRCRLEAGASSRH